jgi:hypothetical protein
MSKARNLSKLLSEGNVSSFGSLATKNTVSATEIATGAIEGKLGYTPAPTNNPTLTGNITLAGSTQQIVFDRTLGDNWMGDSIVIENGKISVFEPPTNFYNWLSSLQAGDKFTIQPGGQEVTVASTTDGYTFLITTEEVIDETPWLGPPMSSFWITSFTQTIVGSPNLLLGSTPIGDLATKDSISTTEIDDGNVTASKLASTLDLSGKTITLPPANAVMTRILSGNVTSSVSSIDLDLSGQTFQVYKLIIRNWLLSGNGYPVLRKMTAANTAVGTCYGGGHRAGEGNTAAFQYGGADSFYLTGSDSTTNSGNTYLMSWDITIARQTDGMLQMYGTGHARVNGGQAQAFYTGALDINTATFWGIRIGSNMNTTNIKYAIYGVNVP